MTGRELFGALVRLVGFGVAFYAFVQLISVGMVLAQHPDAASGATSTLINFLLAVVIGLLLLRFAEGVVRFAYGKPAA
jgi:hypothetical protein